MSKKRIGIDRKGKEMEYVIFAEAVVIILILMAVKGYYDYQKDMKKLLERMYTDYGILPQKQYKPEQFMNIPRYFEKHRANFFIDDITWDDLNMDEVFMKMNYTYSAAGEEYLYYTLRTPVFDAKELKRREELIDYFRNHADERVACQFLCHRLGTMGKFSIYNYLEYLGNLGIRSNVKHYLSLVAVLLAISCMFINLAIGLLMTVVVFVVNILSYFKIKNEIEPYITSFSYVFKLLDTAERLSKQNIPVLDKEWKQLKKASRGLNTFRRGAFLLMSTGRMSGSGNPIEIVLDYLRMIFHLDLIQFNKMLGEVNKHIGDIDLMLTIVGKVETMIAIGAFREGNKEHCIPTFSDKKKILAINLYHPLLSDPVKNDFNTERSVLITGSNASGKSTFLKTLAVNQILAQTVHTCMADSYEASFFRVCSSMALRDNIQGGESYYIVEIKALKRILDELSIPGAPVLCFVDEVLRGTNTVERIAASVQILKSLNKGNCLCFAATHDIELTHLLEKEYDNYHFEEEIEDDDIFFCYKIISGRAQTRNAIKLLRIMGYDKEIIEKAEQMASNFIRSGNWNESGIPT